jgi:hypothetical protein
VNVGYRFCFVQGRIMAATAMESKDTPLQEKLEEMATHIGYFGFLFAILTFIAMIVSWFVDNSQLKDEFTKTEWIIHAIITAVTIIVVAIPEGLVRGRLQHEVVLSGVEYVWVAALYKLVLVLVALCLCACVHVPVCMCLCACACVHVPVCMCLRGCLCACACVCACVRVPVCVCLCACACVRVLVWSAAAGRDHLPGVLHPQDVEGPEPDPRAGCV